MYPDTTVAGFVEKHFAPVRVHAREQRELFQELGGRFDAHWTPTILILDRKGEERHRIEGFLPADDFLAQLELGLAKSKFSRGLFTEAETQFNRVVEEHPDSDAAPEALYWAGVSRYKAMDDPSALEKTAEAFRSRYTGSPWAKKASVWG